MDPRLVNYIVDKCYDDMDKATGVGGPDLKDEVERK
jgi:hypothetical protein